MEKLSISLEDSRILNPEKRNVSFLKPVSGIKEARDAFVKIREDNGWGSSDYTYFRTGTVYASSGRVIARISYNGRMWDARGKNLRDWQSHKEILDTEAFDRENTYTVIPECESCGSDLSYCVSGKKAEIEDNTARELYECKGCGDVIPFSHGIDRITTSQKEPSCTTV